MSATSRRALIASGSRELLLAMFFVGLAAYMTRPLAVDLRGQTLAGIDPPIYVWMVDWLARHLLQPSQLFEGNVFHPAPHAALYSDLALGSALLVAPLAPLVADPVPLYNLSVILTLAFGGWAFCALVRSLSGGVAAGLFAGITAAFGPHQMGHVYQLGLINIGGLALFLIGLHRTLERPNLRNASLTGVAFALNALSCAYFAVAATLLALVFAACNARALRSARPLAGFGAAALLALALLSPYLRAFSQVKEQPEVTRPLVASEDWAFKPGRDLTSRAWVYRRFWPRGGEALFPGVAVLGLGALGIARRCRSWSFLVLGALLLTVLSLGPNVPVLGLNLGLGYRTLFAIPPLDVMMHPYSFAAAARLLLCVLAGLGFGSLWVLASVRVRGLSLVVAAALGILEVAAPRLPVVAVARGIPPVYDLLAGLPEGAVLEVPLERRDAMIWAARHRRPVINGAGGVSPKVHGILERAIQTHWIRPARAGEAIDVDATRPTALLRLLPVRYLIIPAGRSPGLVPLREAVDRSRSFARVAAAGDGDVLYRVLGPETSTSPASP